MLTPGPVDGAKDQGFELSQFPGGDREAFEDRFPVLIVNDQMRLFCGAQQLITMEHICQ